MNSALEMIKCVNIATKKNLVLNSVGFWWFTLLPGNDINILGNGHGDSRQL